MGLIKCAVVVIGWFALMTKTALAHRVMGGRMPVSFAEGLLSGLGHPIIGPDHFAAVIAVGCLAAAHRAGAWLIVGFVLAMIAGAGMHVRGADVPASELMVAASVLVLGALLLGGRKLAVNFAFMLFVLTGFIHGYALGESIAGAEPAPLGGYFLGLSMIQIVVAIAAMLVTRFVKEGRLSEPLPLRVIGAAVGVIGLVFLAQQLAL